MKMISERKSEERNSYHQKLFLPGSNKRKNFGLLERPNFPPSVPQVSYKLFVCGRPGSGKTWARSRLIGQEVCSEVGKDEAVAGIEASFLFWPMKVGGKLILFKLELWEAGEWSVRRYDHILPACREGVSGVLLCFSLTDQTGWQELPRLLANSAQATERATVIPLATRVGCDGGSSNNNWEVSPGEVAELEKRCGVNVLHMPTPVACSHNAATGGHVNDTTRSHINDTMRGHVNDTMRSHSNDTMRGHVNDTMRSHVNDTMRSSGSNAASVGATEEIQAIAPTLNAICTKLWHRDQELMANAK